MRANLGAVTIHGSLFLLTFVSTALAGVQWLNRDPFELSNFHLGLPYSLLLLLFLSSHELGHYFAARLNNVSASPPYFVPFPSFLGIAPFGTLGAVIRLREKVPSRRVLLRIGATGPIAGFVVTTVILAIGFLTLPEKEFLYQIHPEYVHASTIPDGGLTFGKNLLFILLENIVPPSGAFIPPMNEVYHYPLLCVGWFGGFVTSLNLIPVGQLDGGHILKSTILNGADTIQTIATIALFVLGGLGLLPILGIDLHIGWSGWLVWATILLLMRSKSTSSAEGDEFQSRPDSRRLVASLWCAVIFVLTFTPTPIAFQP